MANVEYLDEHKNRQLLTAFPEDSTLYFPVVARKQFYEGHDNLIEVQETKTLVRPGDEINTTVELATVGKNYEVVQNKELFTSIEKQFCAKLPPDLLQGVQVYDKMAYLGKECFREYIFPNVRCLVNNRQIAFRTIVKHGFGGSAIRIFNGAISFFCTNGMISGEYDVTYRRHTSGLSIGDVVKPVGNAIDKFYVHAEEWRHWTTVKVTDADVLEFLDDVCNSDALSNALFLRFTVERTEHGPTLWALYNALTYYASHPEDDAFAVRQTNKDHAASTLNKRELRVRGWANTQEFKKLAA